MKTMSDGSVSRPFAETYAITLSLVLVTSMMPGVGASTEADTLGPAKPGATLDTPTIIPGVIPEKIDLSAQPAAPAARSVSGRRTYIALDQALSDAAAESDLIIHGVIHRVDYRSAATGSDGGTPSGTNAVPLTYLTIAVSEVLAGHYQDAKIVVLLPNVGWIPSTQSFRQSSRLPLLAADDELVLFLAAGTLNGPRYVEHYFVVDGNLYGNLSREVVVDDDDRLWLGHVVSQPRILERPLGVGTMRFIRTHSDDPLQTSRSGPAGTSTPPATAADATVSAAGIADLKRRIPASNGLHGGQRTAATAASATAQVVQSADMSRSVVLPSSHRAVAAPE